MEERNDIVITKYRKQHYADLVESGYLLEPTSQSSYLEPDLHNTLKNLFNKEEIKRVINFSFFLNEKQIMLVAYSKKHEKGVGCVATRRITDNLWFVGSVFVSPAFRGKRIGTLLYEEIFELLKRKNVAHSIGIIARNNVPSIKALEKAMDEEFLHNRVFICDRIGPLPEHNMEKITVRKLRHGEKKRLFEIFELCVGKQWTSYLEIDQGNYLDRIFGPAYFEEYRGILSRLAIKKDILVAERKGELLGYAIPRAVRLFHADYALHLFVPTSKDFDDVCRALLLRSFRPSSHIRENKFSFIYIGNEKSQGHLRKLGFEAHEFLVARHLN